MVRERDRTHFDHGKSERALGIRFRPVEETPQDTVAWYRENGWLKDEERREPVPSGIDVTAAKRPNPYP